MSPPPGTPDGLPPDPAAGLSGGRSVRPNAPSHRRLFAQEEARLAPLDHLPRPLWLGGLTHTQGTLEARLHTLQALRRALFCGSLPDRSDWQWLPTPVASAVHDTLHRLALAPRCKDQQQLSDTVLLSLMFHLDFITHYQDRGASVAEAVGMALSAFAQDWQERSGQLDALTAVFGSLPEDAKNHRWDALRGVLQSSGWQEVVRIHRLLEALPGLTRIVRELGRALATDEPDARSQTPVQVQAPAQARQEHSRTVQVPDMPGQTRGIHRSDRIARMLPSEALLLRHPVLRLLWHARRAERTLLTYEDDDRMSQVQRRQSPVTQPRAGTQPATRAIAGPILLCVDTSGSMQGGAEAVAKAVVLEAMRSAHRHSRACHVFAFGGSGEVLELELSLDTEGIARLSDFLGQAFRGGTDICGPLERVITKLQEQRWQRADLLIATDGEFGATPEVAARLEDIKQALGLRVQGVLIGDRETLGLMEVCDHIYAVRDWRRFGGMQVDSPVHTPQLTALYFPAALRNASNRAATVSGSQTSAAVRAGLLRGAGDSGSKGS